MDRLEFLITYVIMFSSFIALSWSLCNLSDYIGNKIRQSKQNYLQTITATRDGHGNAA